VLGLIVLIAVQFAVGYFGAPVLLRYLPVQGDLVMLVKAGVYAVIVWVVALVGAAALKGVESPTARTMVAALIGAGIGAALTLLPDVRGLIPLRMPLDYFPLVGAIIGYVVRQK
jgi:hypothetical protein